MAPRQCSEETNKLNQDIAKRRLGNEEKFCETPSVLIRKVEGRQVTLFVRLTDGTSGEFSLTWGNPEFMWVFCPSSLPSPAERADESAPGVPEVNAMGTLYLEGNFVKANRIHAPRPKFPRDLGLKPKFPKDLGPGSDGLVGEIRIQPATIELDGLLLIEGGQREVKKLDLLDRDLVPEQTITIGDAAIEVRLTERGFAALKVPVARSGVAQFAATNIKLHGKQLVNVREDEGTIDLMDFTDAARGQAINLDGKPVHARLTASGCNRFNVAILNALP